MKKIVLFLAVLLAFQSHAQKKPKIKGNKEVLIKKFTTPYFKQIEVGEKFEIELKKSVDTTRVVIETDDNLFDVIHFKVENEVLKFYTIMEIVKKKRLKITVFVPDAFNKIKLYERAKVFNKESFDLQQLTLETAEKSKTDLSLNVKNSLVIEAGEKSDIQLDVVTESVQVHLFDNAKLKTKLSAKYAEIALDNHAYCKLEGSGEYLYLEALDKSEYKSPDYQLKDAKLVVADKANVYVNVSNNVELNLSGQSAVYLYGNPKINLKTFKDNAVLYKK